DGGELLTIRIPYEALQPGPIGKKLAVIDYDGALKRWYPAIDLEDPRLLAGEGEWADEANPKFHQQMAYAVVMQTILRFEFALGREIQWPRRGFNRLDPFYGKLRIFPHALQEANAFFDPELNALLFGYFPSQDATSTLNLPDQTVFTCLSYDIVAHEATHALLHSTNPHFIEPTGYDAPAFHEAFADIVALFQHFSFEDSLIDAVQRTGGLIYRNQFAPDVRPEKNGPQVQAEIGQENPLVQLARQFGEAMGKRAALRSALGTAPGSLDLDAISEPHDRGAILVAAVFDAFFSVYVERTRDLIKIAYPDGRLPKANFLNADLAKRLAGEAARTAERMLTICIRALDYCAPVDIEFGDYLRALVTADYEVSPEDGRGYRRALIQAFRSRGIRPKGVLSYSEESLRWSKFDAQKHSGLVNNMQDRFLRIWQKLTELENAEIEGNEPAIQRAKSELFEKLWGKAEAMRAAFGLTTKNFKAESYALVQRLNPNGSVRRILRARCVEQRDATFDAGPGARTEKFEFKGGCTLLVERDGTVSYVIGKSLGDKDREQRQRQYLEQKAASYAFGAYKRFSVAEDCGLKAVHRGY
ncbi:MAG: hypothetical protein ABI995_14605, partial [Acidobacteriota bacterium]